MRPRGQVTGIAAWSTVLAWSGFGAGLAADRLDPTRTGSVGALVWGSIGLGLVVSASTMIDVRHRGEVESIDMFEVAVAPALYFLGGLRAVLLVAATKLLSQLVLRMPPAKAAFNVAQWSACAGCGALALAASTRSGAAGSALPLAMVAVAAVNLVALVVLFAILDGWPAVRQLLAPRPLEWTVLLTTATTAAGLVSVAAARWHPVALTALVVLPLLLQWAGRGYALARLDLDRMRRLQAGTRLLSAAPDVRIDPQPFLAEVATSCRAVAAELAVHTAGRVVTYRHAISTRPAPELTGGDAALTTAIAAAATVPVHLVARPRGAGGWLLQSPIAGRMSRCAGRLFRSRLRPRRRAGAGAVDIQQGADPAVMSALQAAGWRDCLAVPLLIDDNWSGFLAVFDRSGFAEVDQSDLSLLAAFARELATALQRAALVDEIAGARRDAARIIDSSSDGIIAVSEDGAVVTCNQAFATLASRSATELQAPGGLALLETRDVAGAAVHVGDWARSNRTPDDVMPDHLTIRTPEGGRRWLSCSYARSPRDGGDGTLLVISARDVTELRRQRSMLTGQARVLEMIASDQPLDASLDAMIHLVTDQLVGDAEILLASSGTPRLVTRREGVGQPAKHPWLQGRLNRVSRDVWARAAERGEPFVVPARIDPGGGPTPTLWAMPIADGPASVMRGALAAHAISRDVESIHEVLCTAARLAGIALSRDSTRRQLTHQATHDPLTHLPNRSLYLDRCQGALQVAARRNEFAVALFVDLDRFKVVNDSLGHDAGDLLLVTVADRLRLAVRPSDIIARFGGDEFTILCQGVRSSGEARVLAERVLDLFVPPFQVKGQEVFETASVGIAVGRAPLAATDLVQQADAAMYRAKARGGNRFEFFDDKLRQEADARRSAYSSLRRAVENHEFEVHYQPTFALSDGAAVGMEALARWRHPTRGLLGPDAFIDLAEETGLIVPLGQQILRTVLAQLPSAGPDRTPLRVSVNLSARQLTQPDLVMTIEQALAVADVPAARLSLEITESLLLTDSATIRSMIGRLKQIGVHLSLDDFGTGHSSMDYLKFLPVDELKIERRFVAGLLTDHRDHAIVTAITHLGHDLGLRVVAEGVETAAQAERLRHVGCDVGQGYFFGRPQPLTTPRAANFGTFG